MLFSLGMSHVSITKFVFNSTYEINDLEGLKNQAQKILAVYIHSNDPIMELINL